jgi:histidyl-tRNA synthetase
MRGLQLTSAEVRARASDRRILHGYLSHLRVPEGSHSEVFGVIDKLQRLPENVATERLKLAGVPIKSIAPIIELRQAGIHTVSVALREWRNRQHVEDFMRYVALVSELVGSDDWVRLDLSIVRGLDYYTGIVFELFDNSGSFRAIAGGGRYDSLVGNSGGPDMPALGFGMGDVVIGELLRESSKMHVPTAAPDFYLVSRTDGWRREFLSVARDLRAAGASVEYPLRPQSSSRQLKAAYAAGAKYAVVIPEHLSKAAKVYVTPITFIGPSDRWSKFAVKENTLMSLRSVIKKTKMVSTSSQKLSGS